MTTTTATYDDANLILRLYEMRREERMRAARAWFGGSFKARTFEEWTALCPPGTEENASYRMVTTYWEMVASFVTSGVLNRELFFQSGRELLYVWEKAKEVIVAVRTAQKDATYLRNVETVALEFAAWWQVQAPDAYASFSKRVRG